MPSGFLGEDLLLCLLAAIPWLDNCEVPLSCWFNFCFVAFLVLYLCCFLIRWSLYSSVRRSLPSFLPWFLCCVLGSLIACLLVPFLLTWLLVPLFNWFFADILFPCLLVGEHYLACMVDYSVLASVIYLGFFLASLFVLFRDVLVYQLNDYIIIIQIS